MITYKELNASTQCFTPHAPSDYHCMCGQIKPNGREHILPLIAEVRALKKRLNSWRQR